jgi:hypothetical protein
MPKQYEKCYTKSRAVPFGWALASTISYKEVLV